MRSAALALFRWAAAGIACACVAGPLAAQRPDTGFARITYVSGTSVYVDAGESDGLTQSSRVEVVRARAVVAVLRVVFLSPSRAQCTIESFSDAPIVGDTVRFIRRSASPVTRDSVVAPAREAAGRSAPSATPSLRGRVGVRYYGSWQRDSGNASWSQPMSDVRLDGPLPGTPLLAVALDARARRTQSATIGGVSRPARASTSVYQASLSAQLPRGAHLTLGRQYSSAVSDISLFDGALAELTGDRLLGGVFAGTQPDAATMRFSSRVREYGVFVGAHRSSAVRNWSVTTGAIGSYDSGNIDREFLFTSAIWSSDAWSAYATQEVDYNRGWKRALGMSTLSATGTMLSASVKVAEPLRLRAGYDSRQAVRLYRNYVTPEITFDDAFRTGIWGGLSARVTRRADVHVDVRRSSGGGGDANVYSATAALRDIARLPVTVRARSSRFVTSASTGWLHSGTVGYTATTWMQLDATGGLRLDSPRPGTASAAVDPDVAVRWLELGADLALGRSWYLMLTATRDSGGWESSDHLYSGITFRF